MPRKYGPRRPEFYKYYSVYDRKTDTPVFIHGTAVDCAKAMGVKVGTLYHYVSRTRKGTDCKYDIFIDDPEEDEYG
jgi:hypothetical protein